MADGWIWTRLGDVEGQDHCPSPCLFNLMQVCKLRTLFCVYCGRESVKCLSILILIMGAQMGKKNHTHKHDIWVSKIFKKVLLDPRSNRKSWRWWIMQCKSSKHWDQKVALFHKNWVVHFWGFSNSFCSGTYRSALFRDVCCVQWIFEATIKSEKIVCHRIRN